MFSVYVLSLRWMLVNAGKVALISRGSCYFFDKVKMAQDAGAIAVIIYNNLNDDDLIHMASYDADEHMIEIPSFFVRREDSSLWRESYLGGITIKFVLSHQVTESPTTTLPPGLTESPTQSGAPSVSPTPMPTVANATLVEQGVAITGLQSTDQYTGDLKRVIEAGYAYSIRIGTLQGQMFEGCSLISRATTRRADLRILVTFECSISPDRADNALSQTIRLTANSLAAYTAAVNSELGTNLNLPTILGVQSAAVYAEPDATPTEGHGSVEEDDNATQPPALMFVIMGLMVSACVLCCFLCIVCLIRKKRRGPAQEARLGEPRANDPAAPPTYVESYVRGDRSVNNSDATTVLPPPEYEVCDGNPLAEGMSRLDDILRGQSPGAVNIQMNSTGNEVEVQPPEDGNPAYSNDSDVGVEMVSLSPREAPDFEVHSVFGDDAGNRQDGADGADGPPTYTAIQSRPRRLNLMGSAPK